MLVAAAVERAMGRVPISKSRNVRLWTGAVNSSENSQEFGDWYTFAHVIHGVVFYGVFRLDPRSSACRARDGRSFAALRACELFGELCGITVVGAADAPDQPAGLLGLLV
jgi:hypothetical protein